ncbi:MAG TPA: BlaI/MecI/CopY family transcriptional regulator [Saprospiraceae bacterium]|nr:BlaI/MecI/CopY family transcriptional regulator [Saprospiraceae bacterium]
MNKIKSLTRAEEDIMQHIWQLGRCTVSDILDLLPEPRPPHSSISSIVRILERKNFVGHKSYGRTYEYYPLISKDEYSRKSVLSLIRDYFNGSPSELVSFLIAKEHTSVEEMHELINDLKKKKV